MSYGAIGHFTCKECQTDMEGTFEKHIQMMDIVPGEDDYGTLIFCEKCQKWVRWE